MYIIAIVSEKGGVGKTTLALDLAVHAVQEKQTVAVLDLDPQATASKWTDRRDDEFPWVVPTPGARLASSIRRARDQGVNFIVIDTPPHSATDAIEAARCADVVVTPIEPHVFSLETLGKLRDLLKVAGDPPAFCVVNKAPVQGSEGLRAIEHMQELDYPVCPILIHNRAAHRHAGNVGKTAVEYEASSKAAEETLQVYLYTIQFVNSKRNIKISAQDQPTHARLEEQRKNGYRSTGAGRNGDLVREI